MGGLGFHEQHYAHLALLDSTSFVMHGTENNNAFVIHLLLPRELLVDGAAQDLGRSYGERLLLVRNYLTLPGRRIDLQLYMPH